MLVSCVCAHGRVCGVAWENLPCWAAPESKVGVENSLTEAQLEGFLWVTLRDFWAPRCNWEPGAYTHLHFGLRHSSARALSAPTSSVVNSPFRGLWLPKFPALGHSYQKGSSETCYAWKHFWAPTLAPDFEPYYNYALYLLKLNYWPHVMVWP